MATRTLKNTGGNWSATGTWNEGAVPTSADDVVINVTSGSANLTLDSALCNCRSLIMSAGFTGTITHPSSKTLQVGDATPGTGNAALTFLSSGWTYTPSAGAIFKFVSTSSTQQTVNFGSKLTSSCVLQFNGVGGSWSLSSVSGTSISTVSLTNGTLSISATFTCAGFSSGAGMTLTLNSSSITATAFTFTAGGTVNAGTSTLTMSGSGTFAGGGFSFNNVVLGASNFPNTITGSNTFASLTKSIAGATTLTFTAGTTQTITGSLTLQGASGQLLSLVSDSPGTPWNISVPATQTLDYLSVTDSNNTGTTADVSNGHSTNGGGNTGWNFGAATIPGGSMSMLGVGL